MQGSQARAQGDIYSEYRSWFIAASLALETLKAHEALRDPVDGARHRATLDKFQKMLAAQVRAPLRHCLRSSFASIFDG